VADIRACLVDVYDTMVSCDFGGRRNELATLAGVPVQAWREGYRRIEERLNAGRLTKEEGFGLILRESGVHPQPDLVRALLARDRELLFATTRLYDDVLPFLDTLRSRGIKIAIVSNCTEYTRELLVEAGVAARADALVLSCEVGAAKPAAQIFRHALDQLEVTAGAALFVDDQAAYCAGAVALGINTVQIAREGAGTVDGKVAATGIAVVRSLPEVEAILWG
jgi:putative hydrolase of the HAD superfamily